jgi:hypothetical protein
MDKDPRKIISVLKTSSLGLLEIKWGEQENKQTIFEVCYSPSQGLPRYRCHNYNGARGKQAC